MSKTEDRLKEENKFFILYKPKDIVSGDFYWGFNYEEKAFNTTAEKGKELFYMATADCTGHGVPGAFMSMLNISYLNEVIVERRITQPHQVLNHVRDELMRALNPEGSEEESKDGMDCVLCAYDFENMKLEFAAANNPLWLVRDKKIIEYKPDKMPVGKYGDEHHKSFTLQSIDLKAGDIIYTFTDGYADQFGGPKGKKFKYKQLEEVLMSVIDLPMDEQRKVLETTIDNWKEGYDQVDDILVIGVQI